MLQRKHVRTRFDRTVFQEIETARAKIEGPVNERTTENGRSSDELAHEKGGTELFKEIAREGTERLAKQGRRPEEQRGR